MVCLINENTLRKKILGCWLGKAVGGTLGQPYEGCKGPLNLTYYNPVPTDMIPNDDLDLQVLWAYVLDNMEKPQIQREVLAKAWLDHVDFPWDEYGVAIRNLKAGILAPYSGSYDNYFTDGLGAAIRSEIWACFAPGNPILAAKCAYEDACVDHAGNGIYAEQFLAALQSMAFVESDINKLIDEAVRFIPQGCSLYASITDTLQWCSTNKNWLSVREQILKKYGSDNFTDCVMNMGFIVLSLVLSGGNFGKAICMAVNCGYDADCTGATVGAIMGLLNPDSIGEHWLKPIGRKLIINDGITGITHPNDLDGFTDQIISLQSRIKISSDSETMNSTFKTKVITAECGLYQPWFVMDPGKFNPVMPENTEINVFDGNYNWLPAEQFPHDSLYLMKFKIVMPETKMVRVMFNTPSVSRIWLDGKYAFGCDGGMMSPSFHRVPINQYTDIELSTGEHEIIAGIARKDNEANIEFVIGVGDFKSMQWLDVF